MIIIFIFSNFNYYRFLIFNKISNINLLYKYNIKLIKSKLNALILLLKISFKWGLGIGDWGLGIGPNPQSPNPQSPIPNPQSP